MFQEFESNASVLRNLYWLIRADRSGRRRTFYRQAAKEKGHLVALGYCPEVIRLYALYLRNPRLEYRLHRVKQAFQRSLNRVPDPVQLKLF